MRWNFFSFFFFLWTWATNCWGINSLHHKREHSGVPVIFSMTVHPCEHQTGPHIQKKRCFEFDFFLLAFDE